MAEKKRKIVLAALAAVIGLIAVWYTYQITTAKPHLGVGGGVFDEETGKFYPPDEMQRMKKEREAHRRTMENK